MGADPHRLGVGRGFAAEKPSPRRHLGGDDQRAIREEFHLAELAARCLGSRTETFLRYLAKEKEIFANKARKERERREATSVVTLSLERRALQAVDVIRRLEIENKRLREEAELVRSSLAGLRGGVQEPTGGAPPSEGEG